MHPLENADGYTENHCRNNHRLVRASTHILRDNRHCGQGLATPPTSENGLTGTWLIDHGIGSPHRNPSFRKIVILQETVCRYPRENQPRHAPSPESGKNNLSGMPAGQAADSRRQYQSTKKDRARYIIPAREAGFKVIGYYFPSRIEDSIKRNEQRPRHQVIASEGITATHSRLELPSIHEGFDELYLCEAPRPRQIRRDEIQRTSRRSVTSGNVGAPLAAPLARTALSGALTQKP